MQQIVPRYVDECSKRSYRVIGQVLVLLSVVEGGFNFR